METDYRWYWRLWASWKEAGAPLTVAGVAVTAIVYWTDQGIDALVRWVF